MGRFIANLAVSFAIVLAAMLIVPVLSAVWGHAFVYDRTFTAYFGLLGGGSLLMWLYYFLCFFALGTLVSAFVRSPRPLAWGFAVGSGYCIWWLAAGSMQFPHPSIGAYIATFGEYASAVVGCVAGVAVSRRMRRVAPNNSSKPTPLRGAA